VQSKGRAPTDYGGLSSDTPHRDVGPVNMTLFVEDKGCKAFERTFFFPGQALNPNPVTSVTSVVERQGFFLFFAVLGFELRA
jgi:hypothetical protein